MKILRFSLLALWWMLVMNSCQKVEKIEMAGNISPKITANCVAIDGETFVFHITKSLSALDNAKIKPLKNASIELSDDKGSKEIIKWDVDNEAYLSQNMIAEAGKTYSVKITAPGLPVVTSQTIIPNSVNLTPLDFTVKGKINTTWSGGGSGGSYTYCESASISITLADNPNEKNNYAIELESVFASGPSSNFSYYWDWSCLYPGLERVYGYDVFRGYGNIRFYLKDEQFNGKNIKLNFNAASPYGSMFLGNETDSIIGYNVMIKNMTDDLYLHWNSIDKAQETEGNPFEEPVQIYHNMKGGYGIFGGFNENKVFLPLK